jgi:16S rRNA (guanine966-N2)-methyltransferase
MRITGGIHRSRRLVAPGGSGTRPTADRVREALFSMLSSRGALADAVVLDLYAGTGALGLEALSRGARESVFVESDRAALEALGKNVDSLGERARTRVLPGTVERCVRRVGGPFTLVLCDPPYADLARAARVLGDVAASGALAPGALIVLEHASRDKPPEITPLACVDARTYGDTAISIYELSQGAASV